MSIKNCYEITAFPLTNVLRLKHNLLPLTISHGNWFWLYLFKGDVCITDAARRATSETYVAWLETTQALNIVAAISFRGRIRATLHRINGRESHLYSRAATYEVFIGGYSTLNDHMTFYICYVICKCGKKISIAVSRNIHFSNCPKKHLMRFH